MRAPLRRSVFWLTLCSSWCMLGCHGGEPLPVDAARSKRQAIAFGEDSSRSAVLSLERKQGDIWDLCSASLIAPRLVLTAAHCVADGGGAGSCSDLRLGPAAPLESLRLSSVDDLGGAPEPSWNFLAVSELHFIDGISVTKQDNQDSQGQDAPLSRPLCGADLAVLVLTESMSSEQAAPLDVDRGGVLSNEKILAVGYGAGHPSGSGERERRSSGSLTVHCVAESCEGAAVSGWAGGPALNAQPVASNEFITEPGPCPGDSGGPALQEGAIVGVLSRGHEDCTSPIFTLPKDNLAHLVERISSRLGEPVPAWAESQQQADEPPRNAGGSAGGIDTPMQTGGAAGADQPPEPDDDKTPSGCHVSAWAETDGRTTWGLLAATGWALFSRRSSRKARRNGSMV